MIKYMFQPHGDNRGQLVALEEYKDIPFEIKRVYYMYDTGEGVVRGHHAHKTLQQILICIHGSCKIKLDNGREQKEVALEKPYEGLYVSNAMWREMYDFSSDAVLLVLASELYDENDYIRDYNDFIDFVNTLESR
ncbi:FdtA/QdtA family cupin domain-containing protein [Pseudobutyrivibrio ruminis]|uniref:sugar 3,4-ketoisomerase n=1 Tax=Pseudobutyrivibrio ruminis TaxID=46206 RepID=UPI002E8E1EC9|nr:FdtA/QdtA family cupin domain-containing protein [Pseudobutyrivibrio ruminis]